MSQFCVLETCLLSKYGNWDLAQAAVGQTRQDCPWTGMAVESDFPKPHALCCFISHTALLKNLG